MCKRRFLCFVMSVFIWGLVGGSVASAAEYTTPQALSIGDTYRLNCDGHTGDEATTEPKTDANDGLNGDNIYFQRYNVARAHNDYWYTSLYQVAGEPDPSGPQWVDYKPLLTILGPGRYHITTEYRDTGNRTNVDTPYTVYHEGGSTTTYVNQSVGDNTSYYPIDLGEYDLGSTGYVRIQDPGTLNVLGFHWMRFTYVGPPSGDPVAVIDADPVSGDIPLTVSFDGSGSYDNDGTIVSYEWDFTDDGTYDENNATATTSHIYSTKGVYDCRLRVTDNESKTNEAVVTIEAAVTFEDYKVAEWTMDDNAASTTVVDSIGSNNGTFSDASGNPNTSAHHSATCQEGSGSLIFDGVDDYVTIPRNSVLETGNAATHVLSVSAWVKSDLTSAPGDYTCVAGTGDGGWEILSTPGVNQLAFACWLLNGASGQTAVVSNPTAVFDGEWHHVVGVYDGSSVHMYVDGNHAVASTIGGEIRNMFDDSVLLGENNSATGRHWDGLIDDVQIYDTALSADDVHYMGNPNDAWNPSPADGSLSVDESSVTLSWSAGELAVTHDVYFGTSESLVTSRDGSVYEGNIGTTSHSVGTLLAGTEYFWAVDEVNGSEPESPWPGEVWSFRTSLSGTGGGVSISSDGHWIEFRDEKKLLIGDSATQGWMILGANFDQEAYIDALASRGINILMIWSYIGTDNQTSDARVGYDSPEIWPWQESGGTFDLNSFNSVYFTRLESLINYANDNDIVVLITIHDGWTKTLFADHPFNSANGGPLTSNSQYVELADYNNEMGETYNPSWNYQQKNQYYQERFVDRLVQSTDGYPNVILEIFNEGEWYNQTYLRAHEVHFCNFIKARTSTNPTMVNDDHIGGTDFRGEANCDIISWHRPNWSSSTSAFTAFDYYDGAFSGTPAKPFYFSEPVPEYRGDSSVHDGLMRLMWGTTVAGVGFVVQNDTSWGFDPLTNMAAESTDRDIVFDREGYCATFFNNSGVGFGDMAPNGSLASSGVCLANSGEEYIVYSQSNSTFTVNLSAATGKTLNCRFYNPRTGAFNATFQRSGGSSAELFTKPSTSDWVLHIIATTGGLVPTIAEVSPDPDTSSFAGVEYTKQLQLAQGDTPITWSVVQGPSGIAVNSSGYVDNWSPGGCDVGTSVTIEIRAQNASGSDTETWQVQPELYYMTDSISNLSDLMVMADEWLATSGIMATDLDCSGGIDLGDFVELAAVWLEVPAPGQATNPSPANGVGNVGIDDNLSWTAGTGAASHDVYFGTSSPGTSQGNQAGTTFEPGTMANDGTYFWRIDEVNTGGTTTGTVWSFTTASLNPDLVISGLSPASYEVSYDDLNVGELIYVDRAYTYVSVPAGYQGKTYIKTSNDDKDGSPNNAISFDVNVPVTVYVAHDDRIITKPTWLSSFVDTGDNLVDSSEAVNMSLYGKAFPAGTVNLGENGGYQPNCGMYTVVVIEQ